MAKKCLLVSVLALFVAGGIFGQADFESMPKNTVTVDFGPTLVGATIKSLGDAMNDAGAGTSSSGFGIAAQYERQLLEKLSVQGRFAYVGGGLGFKEENAVLEMKLNSFSLEGHARFYPFRRGVFFLDGMLGYANMATTFSGKAKYTDKNTGAKVIESVSVKASRSYFKYGTKIGWRIDFGTSGGFIFEPSFGWYGVAGIGDTFGKKLFAGTDADKDAVAAYDDLFEVFEILGIGGLRLSLAFGWRF